MPSFDQSDLKKREYFVIKDGDTGIVNQVVFPNGIQVGLSELNFNNGITLPNLTSAPQVTKNSLYAINGDIYFNGVIVAPSGGSSLIVKEEGTVLTQKAASINFVGPEITVTNSGNDVTVTTNSNNDNSILAGQVFG
jgi:hypothetical protein